MSPVVGKPNVKFLLRSSLLHFVHHANRACAETLTRCSRSTYLLAKTPPLVMCPFFTHLGPHIYLINAKCLFFKVLQLHTPLINPAVLKPALQHINYRANRTQLYLHLLTLHLGPYINYRVNITQHKLHISMGTLPLSAAVCIERLIALQPKQPCWSEDSTYSIHTGGPLLPLPLPFGS